MAILTKAIQRARHRVSFHHHYPAVLNHAKSSSIHAFSTIELIICLLIVMMLASISAPSLSRWLSVVKIHAAATDLAKDMQLGRRRAISENTFYRITFNPSGNSYQIDKDIAGEWQTVNPLQPLPAGIDLETAPTNPIVFETLGTVDLGTVSDVGTVTLRNFQDQRRSVVVSQSGRISVVKKLP